MTNREQLIELAGRTVYEADPETRTVWPAMNVHDPYANPREEAVAWEDVPTKLSELTHKQYLYPGEVLVDAGWRPPPECDGSERCTVTLHTHGCLSDYGDCDDPTDHDLGTATTVATTPTPTRRTPMACDQELCPMWDGDTCPCDTFGLDRDDLPTDGVFTVEVPTDG